MRKIIELRRQLIQASEVVAQKNEFISQRKCAPPPYGCGRPWGEFRDQSSEREAQVSGLCQSCQDDFFGKE